MTRIREEENLRIINQQPNRNQRQNNGLGIQDLLGSALPPNEEHKSNVINQ